MNMISHENKGMNCYTILCSSFTHEMQICLVVRVITKTGIAIISALNNM